MERRLASRQSRKNRLLLLDVKEGTPVMARPPSPWRPWGPAPSAFGDPEAVFREISPPRSPRNPQPLIGPGGYAGTVMRGEIKGHAVQLLMLQGGENSLAMGHLIPLYNRVARSECRNRGCPHIVSRVPMGLVKSSAPCR
jgi:hypothetical protein